MRALRPLLVALLLVVAGCLGDNQQLSGRLAPRFEPAPPGAAPPRLALVLGSGGSRGFAHIGVLKVLAENNIRPDLVIGASVGAVVGALYCGGMSAAELETLALDLKMADFFEFGLLTGREITGRKMQEFVNEHVQGRPIEQLPIAFAAAATRQRDAALVLFNRGDTGAAVRASGASPGQFEPVRIAGESYVDGDEASPVPIHAARRMGARVVIAVDVSAFVAETPAGARPEWVAKDARRAKQVAAEAPEADVLIHPGIGYYAGRSEDYRRRVIALAERAAREKLPEVLAALARARDSTVHYQPAKTE